VTGWDGKSDFYEDDEPIEDILAAWENGAQFTTSPPFTYWLKPRNWLRSAR